MDFLILILGLLPILIFYPLFRFIADPDEVFSFVGNVFKKTQGWKGASDFR